MALDPEVDAPLEPLACGRDAAQVWDRAATGVPPDGHERGCPHCGAVRADAAGLGSLVHRMAAQDIEPPASVVDRVITAVISELRPRADLLLESPHGANRLSHPAAAAVLRAVVDRMDGLRARSCRIEQPPGGFHADVAITVTARFGVDLASVTARVRQLVTAAGAQVLGVPVRRVDIDVVDIWEVVDIWAVDSLGEP
jgi:hypothetical protein